MPPTYQKICRRKGYFFLSNTRVRSRALPCLAFHLCTFAAQFWPSSNARKRLSTPFLASHFCPAIVGTKPLTIGRNSLYGALVRLSALCRAGCCFLPSDDFPFSSPPLCCLRACWLSVGCFLPDFCRWLPVASFSHLLAFTASCLAACRSFSILPSAATLPASCCRFTPSSQSSALPEFSCRFTQILQKSALPILLSSFTFSLHFALLPNFSLFFPPIFTIHLYTFFPAALHKHNKFLRWLLRISLHKNHKTFRLLSLFPLPKFYIARFPRSALLLYQI